MNRGHTFAPGAIDGPYRSPRAAYLRKLARRAAWLVVAVTVVCALAGVAVGGVV